MRHGTKTVHAFTWKVISYIKENLHAITKVLYFNDEAASQYKNFVNFVNLCYHEIDHGIQAQWHFFLTSHGKSPCDGIGGTIKRFVARETLQATENYQILSPYQMFQRAKQNIAEIIFFYVVDQEVSKNAKTCQLEQKYSNCTTVSGTRFSYCFIPLSQKSPNISSSKLCIDFFGPPWAKAKNIVCEKKMVNK